MKKTIAILLVLVLAGVGLFATPAVAFSTGSTNLTLTTEVFALNLFKISAGSYTDAPLFSTFFGTNADDVVNTIAVDANDGLTADTYLTMGTNSTSGFTVKIAASTTKFLLADELPIDYTITCADGLGIYDTQVGTATPLLTVQRTSGAISKVVSKKLTVAIDQASYNSAAVSDEYEATVVFEIVS